MTAKQEFNYDLINSIYRDWDNEKDLFNKRKKEYDIKRSVYFSKEEFLKYSAYRNFYRPLTIFRTIFSLSDVFETLEEMKKRGEDISEFTNSVLFVDSIEDARTLSKVSTREIPSEISRMTIICLGNNVLLYGDTKNIGQKFPNIRASNLTLEQIEQIMKSKKKCRGVPITITIDNIGELPLHKLEKIEQFFDVSSIKIVEKTKEGKAHQGECNPLIINSYKEIRKAIDDIIKRLYVHENLDKMYIDYELAIQIVDSIAQKIEKDYESAKKTRNTNAVINASGLAGLLTGKSLCKGFAEIFRNVLSCVNIESVAIDGFDSNVQAHTWNQVKLGEEWLNVDLTLARDEVCRGEKTGDLFMSDLTFFGPRRKTLMDKGKQSNGKSLECLVDVGGHLEEGRGANHRKCIGYMPPQLTLMIMQQARRYEEEYQTNGKNTGYKGPVPYVGSNVQKLRMDASRQNMIKY